MLGTKHVPVVKVVFYVEHEACACHKVVFYVGTRLPMGVWVVFEFA
jgi:hypothetical protein